MLKYHKGDSIRLIKQPDHAALSGLLASHWGNDEFTKPGFYAPAPDSKALRDEVVFGIAEHDNGWWEWEADPSIDPQDGLPRHFLDAHHDFGHERWIRGLRRFADARPYASLLISYHAYRLSDPSAPEEFSTFFSSTERPQKPDAETAEFLAQLRAEQAGLEERLSRDEQGAAALAPESLHPHVRLLQTLDFISLWLCASSSKPLSLPDVPRAGWDDRVTLELAQPAPGYVSVTPYPFDRDRLTVGFVCRHVPVEASKRPELRAIHPDAYVVTLSRS